LFIDVKRWQSWMYRGPLSGMLLLFSVVKMDLNCSFKIVAFSVGLVTVLPFLRFISVPMPLFSCF